MAESNINTPVNDVQLYVDEFSRDLKKNNIKPIYAGKKKDDDFFSFYDETTQFLDIFFKPDVIEVKYTPDGAHKAEKETYMYDDESFDRLFDRVCEFMKPALHSRDERRKMTEEEEHLESPVHKSLFGKSIAETMPEEMPAITKEEIEERKKEREEEKSQGNTVEAHERVMPHTYRKMREAPKVNGNDEVQSDVDLAVAKALAKAKNRDMGGYYGGYVDEDDRRNAKQ